LGGDLPIAGATNETNAPDCGRWRNAKVAPTADLSMAELLASALRRSRHQLRKV
jgi:hypothetical protein